MSNQDFLLKLTSWLVLFTFSTLQVAYLTVDTAWAEEQEAVSGLSPVPENPIPPVRGAEIPLPDSIKFPPRPVPASPWGLPPTSQEFLIEQESPLSKEPVPVEPLTIPQVEPPVPLENESHPLAGFTVQATVAEEKETSEKEKEDAPLSGPAITTGNLKDLIREDVQPLPDSEEREDLNYELPKGKEGEPFSGYAVLSVKVEKVENDPLEKGPLAIEAIKTPLGSEGNYFLIWNEPVAAFSEGIQKKPGKKKTKNKK